MNSFDFSGKDLNVSELEKIIVRLTKTIQVNL